MKLESKNPESSENIDQVISSVLKDLQERKVFDREQIDDIWTKAAGEAAARHSKPISLKYHVLIVSVDSSAWLHKLMTSREILTKRINDLCNKEIVKKIILKIT